MANYRKKVRDALVEALDDPATGFNAQLSSLAMEYGIPSFALEFVLPSKNVIYGYFDDESIDVSQLMEFPCVSIGVMDAVKENRVKFSAFSGFVAIRVRFYLRYRKLDDPDTGGNAPDFSGDFEKYVDAVSDAMNAALHAGRGLMQQQSVNHTDYAERPDPVIELGDGHLQTVSYDLGFEVHL